MSNYLVVEKVERTIEFVIGSSGESDYLLTDDHNVIVHSDTRISNNIDEILDWYKSYHYQWDYSNVDTGYDFKKNEKSLIEFFKNSDFECEVYSNNRGNHFYFKVIKL